MFRHTQESRLTPLLPPSVRPFLEAAWRRRTPYALFVGGIALAAVGVSLALPVWFRAQAVVLPPPEGAGDAFGTMASMIENSALSRLGMLTSSTPSDVFAEILRSRTLHETVIGRFGLAGVYRQKNMDLTLREFRRHVTVDINPAGLVTVGVEDRDPQRAAAVANALVEELDRFNREAYNTRGKRTRLFLEERLTDVRTRLADAETRLGSYEEKNKVLASADNSAVEGMASAVAQKINLQIRRSYISSYSPGNSPEMREVEAQLGAVDRELGRLPSLKMEGARLMLEVEIQRKLFTLLTAQYEDARISESRDTPTITILDSARAPQLKSRPKRSVVVGVATGVAMALCAGWTALSIRDPSVRRPV